MIIINIYTSLEDKWYDFVDWLDKYVPVANVVDSIDKIVPSFLIIIALFLLLLIGLFGLLFFGGGSGFAGVVSFEAEVTVLSLQGAPVSGAVVSFGQDCSNKGDVSLRTNSEGKVKFSACSDSAYLRVSKEGYSTKSEDVSFKDKKAKIYLSPLTSSLRKVNVKVRGGGKILPEAELYLVCEMKGKLDVNLVGNKNQPTSGYLIIIPQDCESIQFKAIAEGYNEKKESLGLKEENKTINLEKIDLSGTVVFEVDSASGRKEAVISVIDELDKRDNLLLDSTGTASRKYSPGEYTYSANLLGSQKEGSFTIVTGQTELVEIFFEEVTQKYIEPIVNGTAKGIYLKLIDDGNNAVRGAEVVVYYKEGDDINHYTVRNSNYSGIVEHYHLRDSNKLIYYAVISAVNYETKIIEVIPKVAGEVPQEVIMTKGGSTLQVEVIDDLNKAIKGAVVSIKKKGFDALFASNIYTDKNGLVEFKNLPNGVYEIEAKSLTHVGKIDSIQVNADKKVTLRLVTGTGNVKFNLFNEGKPTNAYCELYEYVSVDENSLIHHALSQNGSMQAVSIQTEKKIFLAVNDSNFIPTQSPIVTVTRGTQTKDLILYRESDLPNSNNVQMFLEGVYNSNPWVSRESKSTALLPGKKYYFLFTLITKASESLLATANVFVSPIDSNTIDANTKMFVEDAYSIKESIVKKSLVMNSSIIEQDVLNIDNVDKAKQLNVYFGEVSGLVAYPILVEASIDANAIGSTILYWEGILGEEKSLLYSKEFVIGEKFCFEKGSCPALLFSNYMRRTSSSNSEWIPIESNSKLQVGDPYELKVVVENLTESDFGEIDLVGEVKKNSQTKITLNNDSNVASSKIHLKPFDKNTSVFEVNPIAPYSSVSIIESIKKGEELKNLKGNNKEVGLVIKNKEDIIIQVLATRTPNVLYSNTSYPYVYIKTSYKSNKSPVKTKWKVNVKGENDPPIRDEAETDGNGEWGGAIDLSRYDEGTVLVFTAEDSNYSNPAYLEITLKKEFNDPVIESVPDCIDIKINGVNINKMKNPMIRSVVGVGGDSFTLESTCTESKKISIVSDLGVSPNNVFSIGPNETKTVTMSDPSSVVSQRGGMLGVYPLQIIDESTLNQIGFIDVIVSGPSEFELKDYIFDMTKTNSVSSKVINKENKSGERLDIYYPQMNISTNSVGLTYTKPGVPETIKFNAVVKSHAIEAITHSYHYGSLIKQSNRKDKCRSKTKLELPEGLKFSDVAQDHTEYITDMLVDRIESAAIIETPDAEDRDPTKSIYALPAPIQNKIRSELNATKGTISQTASTSKDNTSNGLISFAKDDGKKSDFGENLKGNPLKPKRGDIYEIAPDMAGDFSNTSCKNGIPSVGCGSCSGAISDDKYDSEEFDDVFIEELDGEDVLIDEGEGEYSRECKKCEINYQRVSVNPIPPEGFDSKECKLGVVVNGLDYGGCSGKVEEEDEENGWTEIEGDLEESESIQLSRGKTLFGSLEDTVDINGDSIWTRVEENVVGRLGVLKASGCDPCKVLYFGDWLGGLWTKGRDDDWLHKVSGGLFGDGGTTARLYVQDEYSHVITYFNERVYTWEKELEFKPKEGTVTRLEPRYEYKIDPRWMNTKEIISEDVIEKYEGKNVLLEEVMVVPHGIVPFELAEGYSTPDPTNTLVEYRNNGLIYAEIPAETIPEGLRLFLKGGYIYAEYIGEDKAQAGNEIDFTISRVNLRGTEYAVLTIKDWVNGEKIERIFQVKLIGTPSNCYSLDGIAGLTGKEFSPRLLFNWDWDEIAYNQCESTNPNYTYCDATQFTISLFKRLELINTALISSNYKVLPEYSSFYAYLIKDGYSPDFLSDFDEYYSTTAFSSVGFNTTSEFTGYDTLITNNKIDFNLKKGEKNDKLDSNGLPKGGLYRVEVETVLIDPAVKSIFNLGKPNAKINVTFTLIQEAPNYNLFYETPFDGMVGRRIINGVEVFDRVGYGSSLNQKEITIKQGKNPINLVKYDGNPLVLINYDSSDKLLDLKNQVLLSYSSKSGKKVLNFYPMQPTPIVLRITSNKEDDKINPRTIIAPYQMWGNEASTKTDREWVLLSSTLGNSGKCNDFLGREVYSFTEKTDGVKKYFEWKDSTKSGTIELYTTFFTPSTISDLTSNTSKSTTLDLVRRDDVITKLLSIEGVGLQNGTAIQLEYYAYTDYNNHTSLQGLFNMISEGKVCVSQNAAEDLQIWWNQEYLNTLRETVPYNKSNSCIN